MPNGFIPQGSEFQVNTETDSHQSSSSITTLADGGFVVTWQSVLLEESAMGIYGQRFDAGGMAVGDEFQVNTNTSDRKLFTSITSLADGGFVVTWQSLSQDSSDSDYGVYGQRYDVNGAAIGGEFRVNTETRDDQQAPSITALADGGFVVTWESDHDGPYNIYGQRYDATGATVGDEFRVNTEGFDNQQAPSTTTLADGGFVVTWESLGQDGSSYGIYGQRYDANGAIVDGEFQVNTQTTRAQKAPVTTGLNDGGFVVTWASKRQDGSGYGVYGQRYDADGATVGAEFQVNTETKGRQDSPSITALADGGFVVTWASDGQDGDSGGIFGQRYNAAGATVGDEFQVNTETSSGQWRASITALADGGLVVTWHSYDQDGDGAGVFAQQFAAQLFGTADDNEISDTVSANWINGLAGDDILSGKKGADIIFGGKGKDVLNGGKAGDTLKGGKGADTLNGGKGNDDLFGGKGADVFVFAAGDGKDTIFDFKNGKDKLDLTAFEFENKAEAKSHFFERGSASNDVVGFDFDGTNIKIIGLDLGDINNADIII